MVVSGKFTGGELHPYDLGSDMPSVAQWIARVWVSSGPKSWLRYTLPLQAQFLGLMAECGLSTCAIHALFSLQAMPFLPSSASRKSTHPSKSSSDVTVFVKPSWISSRQQSHPLFWILQAGRFS